MYAIPVTIEHGIIQLPPETKLPQGAKKAMLLLEPEIHGNEDIDTREFDIAMLHGNAALEFLASEPDLYSMDDVKPENRNPYFGKL
jgi:hypothetical protein